MQHCQNLKEHYKFQGSDVECPPKSLYNTRKQARIKMPREPRIELFDSKVAGDDVQVYIQRLNP